MANYDLTYEGSRVQSILDTGDELRDAGYIFLGEATPSTVPGTPTERVAYIGGPGTYTNFGSSITVGAGCICVFKYTGSAWSNQVINTGLDSAVNTLQSAINTINNNIGNGYVYAGVATPSTSPVTGKVFYLAVTAGTYTNFGNAVVTAGLNLLKKNGSAWSVDQVIAIDAEPTQGSDHLVKSGGVLKSIIQNGPAFDLSAYNAQGGVLATYADLDAAITALNALPADFKKGGMSVKFVQSSDNKYVQYFLAKNQWSLSVNDWQKVNLEEELRMINSQIGKGIGDYIDYGHYYEQNGAKGAGDNYNCLDFPIVTHANKIFISLNGGKYPTFLCYDDNNVYLGQAPRIGVSRIKGDIFFALPDGTAKVLLHWQKDTEDYSKDYVVFDIPALVIPENAQNILLKANSNRINLINPDSPDIVVGYLERNGVVTYLASYITTGFIPAKPNTQYYDALDYNGNGFQKVLCYDSNYGIISGSYISSSCKTFTTPANTAFVRISFSTNNTKKQFAEVNTNYIPYSNDVSGFIYEFIGDPSSLDTIKSRAELLIRNLFPVADFFVDNSYFDNATGVPGAADTYARTSLIPAELVRYVYAGFKCNGVYCYSANSPIQANFLGTASFNNEQIVLVSGTKYFGINFRKDAQPDNYQNNGFVCNIEQFIEKQSNILYGKKWAVVGDSFSEWTNAQFSDGPYKNKYKTYKFLIALRNNMVIQDLTLSGRTMAYPSDHTFDNAFAKPELYQSIAADADYITIMLGINDVAHLSGFSPDQEPTTGAITIGTIDSSDTGTFYGAWNVVLQWIFENRPNAHVGIIVTNGLAGNGPTGTYSQYGEAIYEALQNIVKRWNIPYIDLNGGDGKTPMMHRGIYPEGTPSALIATKWNAFATTPTGSELNGHTNAVGHEYESTFIENFLRSL